MSEQVGRTGLSSKVKAVGAVVLIGALLIATRLLPVGEYLSSTLDRIRGFGAAGYVVFIAVYVVATVLFLPGSILTLGAGAVFGLAGGFVAVSAGSTLGAAAAFLAGRFLARDAIARKVQGNARFGAIDRAVGREGFKIVLLTRLSPVFPFNLLNYAYGVTTVRFRPYVVASWIGMMPGTLLFVYLGTAAGDLAEGGGSGGAGLVLKLVGLAATIAVTVVITRVARRALKEATEGGASAEI